MVGDTRRSGDASVTITDIVGRNVRRVREQRGWDRERLADEAAYLDLPWDSSGIVGIEEGNVSLSAADLVSLAAVLGIAPHLLLYPDGGAIVAIHSSGSDEQEDDLEDVVFRAETHMTAAEFADWIWDPDAHAATHTGISEQDLWSAAGATSRP